MELFLAEVVYTAEKYGENGLYEVKRFIIFWRDVDASVVNKVSANIGTRRGGSRGNKRSARSRSCGEKFRHADQKPQPRLQTGDAGCVFGG